MALKSEGCEKIGVEALATKSKSAISASRIDDSFWPASLAHLTAPYLTDSSEYVTIGEISSEPANGFDPLAEVKASAAARWESAVNAEGSCGFWHYKMGA